MDLKWFIFIYNIYLKLKNKFVCILVPSSFLPFDYMLI